MTLPYVRTKATDAERQQIIKWGWKPIGNDYEIRGNCPRCGEEISARAGIKPRFAPKSLGFMADVFCNCNTIHDPAKNGCGFYALDIPGP